MGHSRQYHKKENYRRKVNVSPVSNLYQLEQLEKSSWFHLSRHNLHKALGLKFALENVEMKTRWLVRLGQLLTSKVDNKILAVEFLNRS